jgi:TetR/AcrR family transcriptional regulator
VTDSKEKILITAIEVFSQKGFHGVRMDEIAAKAGINKAMIYYYFSTKENLYHDLLKRVIWQAFNRLTAMFDQIVTANLTPEEKIRRIAQVQFDNFFLNINHAKIVLEAIVGEPEEVHRLMDEYVNQSGDNVVERILGYIEDCITRGIFRDINPKHFFISMIGMNLSYFIYKPIAQVFLNMSIDDELPFLQEQRDHVVDLLLKGLLAREK